MFTDTATFGRSHLIQPVWPPAEEQIGRGRRFMMEVEEVVRVEAAQAKELTGSWWWFLIAGVAWMIVSLLVLRFDITSVATIGALIGALLLVAGLDEVFIGLRGGVRRAPRATVSPAPGDPRAEDRRRGRARRVRLRRSLPSEAAGLDLFRRGRPNELRAAACHLWVSGSGLCCQVELARSPGRLSIQVSTKAGQAHGSERHRGTPQTSSSNS